MIDNIEKIKTIKKKYEQEWVRLPQVISIGIGQVKAETIGIIVQVLEITDEVKKLIPDQVEGIPVELQIGKTIRAL